MKIFKKIFLWFYIKIHSLLINISIALHNSDNDIFNADPNIDDERRKFNQTKRHRNQFINMLMTGVREEKMVQSYYELMRKADIFKKNLTPRKHKIAADKHLHKYAEKDEWGRRYEHYGFFDGNHKHSGKTIGEVLEIEFEERRTKDDNYELLEIYDNTPIEVGLVNIIEAIDVENNSNNNVFDILSQSKQFKFPIKISRTNDLNIINKIEELTESLHIKKIGFDYRQLEFFIPIKFKTSALDFDSKIFNELINIKNVYIEDKYGKLRGFNIVKFAKRINHKDTHEVIKFEAIEMETIDKYC